MDIFANREAVSQVKKGILINKQPHGNLKTKDMFLKSNSVAIMVTSKAFFFFLKEIGLLYRKIKM